MLEIRRYGEADDGLRQQLGNALREYNNQRSPHHRASRAPENAARPLDLFVVDDEGRVQAGLVGELQWVWTGQGVLHIDRLWVDESLRGQGYGSRLLGQAEEAAKEAGCTSASLFTYSFQARPFYEARGYRCIGTLSGDPPGTDYHWMTKKPL
jgi:GNAT superfamily N-acetyltransferase